MSCVLKALNCVFVVTKRNKNSAVIDYGCKLGPQLLKIHCTNMYIYYKFNRDIAISLLISLLVDLGEDYKAASHSSETFSKMKCLNVLIVAYLQVILKASPCSIAIK